MRQIMRTKRRRRVETKPSSVAASVLGMFVGALAGVGAGWLCGGDLLVFTAIGAGVGGVVALIFGERVLHLLELVPWFISG